ncbi:hypothetical protein KCP77_08005 [Salmonella enterica subsp. enterica]|nr:hypothetical protein KCP77_08005 [Salmonella enterica subsp. enterica]
MAQKRSVRAHAQHHHLYNQRRRDTAMCRAPRSSVSQLIQFWVFQVRPPLPAQPVFPDSLRCEMPVPDQRMIRRTAFLLVCAFISQRITTSNGCDNAIGVCSLDEDTKRRLNVFVLQVFM